MFLIRFIDLLLFSMVATRINTGACHFDVGLQPFQVPFWCFDVAMQYFEEILLDLKRKKKKKKEKKKKK